MNTSPTSPPEGLAPTLGSDFGDRDGPCTVSYRDFNWNGHPVRRMHSCLGCKHLEIDEEFGSAFCAHPEFLAAYGCHQYLGGNHQHRGKKLCNSPSCPALRLKGEAVWPEQPSEDKISRHPEYRMRDEEIRLVYAIPQPRRSHDDE